MQLNLTKALFLSYLLTVALSCEAAPGELNATATTTPPPCDSLGSAVECLVAYRQPGFEILAGSNGYSSVVNGALGPGPANCGRGARYTPCVPPPNQKPVCNVYNRACT